MRVQFEFQSKIWIENVLASYSLGGLTRKSMAELELRLLRKGCLHSNNVDNQSLVVLALVIIIIIIINN